MLPFVEIMGKRLPMYGICIMLGIFAAALFMLYDCKKNNVRWENAVIVGIIGVISGFIGAKLLYILVTYTPSELIAILKEGDIAELTKGGFVFYGGLIAGVIGSWVGAVFLKGKLREYENVLVKIIPLVHAFGRVGCFFAGCCYGKPTESPIHVVFKEPLSNAPTGMPLIPVQLYEAGFNMILFLVLWVLDRKCKRRLLLPVYITAYGMERFIIEFFRFDEIRGIFFGLSTSQWISIGMCVVGVMLFLFRKAQAVEKSR